MRFLNLPFRIRLYHPRDLLLLLPLPLALAVPAPTIRVPHLREPGCRLPSCLGSLPLLLLLPSSFLPYDYYSRRRNLLV